MATEASLSLGEHLEAFVKRQVRDGHYASESDVIQAGLRLLEARVTRAKALKAALVAGDESGEPTPFDMDEFIEEMRAEHAK